jgi:hypothetical protein
MTRGGRICFFSSLRSSRLAACLSRRRCTRTSSTTPVWSTARHNQCFSRGGVNYDRRDRVEFAPDSPRREKDSNPQSR